MKKILFYYESMSGSGGIERVISDLTNNLCNIYKVDILTCDKNSSFYVLDKSVGFNHLNYSRELTMNKGKMSRILRILTSLIKNHFELKLVLKNYDYIYVATPLAALEVYLLGKKYSSKLVVSEHASFYACNRVYKLIRKVIYPKVYALSVPTTLDTKIYKEKGCNAFYIPHLSSFSVNFCQEKKENIVLNIGRLTGDKQQLLLINIWIMMKKKYDLMDWKLYIVGSGELKNQLEELILDENLQDQVFLFPSTKSIDEFYKKSKIFAFTSKLEGFGMVLLEAMAFGLPCISFNCPSGPADIIDNNKNGFLINCYNKEMFSDKLYELMTNQNIYENFSKYAYDTIDLRSNEDILKKWIILFS